MANVNDLLGQAAFPDQYIPEAADDARAAAIPSGNPYETPAASKQQALLNQTADKQAQVKAASDQKRTEMGGLSYEPLLKQDGTPLLMDNGMPYPKPDMNLGVVNGVSKEQTIPAEIQAGMDKEKTTRDAVRMARGAQPSDYDMAVGRVTGAGDQYMSDREKDIRTMDPLDLFNKYGSEAKGMIRSIAESGNEVGLDRGRADRSFVDYSLDGTKSVGQGIANSVAGLANLGIGAINANAGATVAKAIQSANEYVDGSKSETLQGRKRVMEGMNTLDQRDSRVQEAVDIDNGASPLIAGLSRIGRDALSSVSNATEDGATFIDGTANAVGSLLTAGPIAKGIKAIGSAAVPASLAKYAAAGESSVARGLAAIGHEAPILASIGSTEAGGAYQQLTADIAGRSFEQLDRESKPFRDLVAGGMSKEDARNQIANEAGLKAAAITAPLAAATGTLVSKFEGDPFAAKSVSSILGNLFREGAEEGIQGGTGQLAQNYAEQQTANQNKNLSDDVGRQVGEGALYGVGAAGLVQVPTAAKVAAGAVGSAANAAVDFGANTVANRAAAVNAANEAASPLAADKVAAQAEQTVQTQPVRDEVVTQAINEVDAAPEVKEQMSENLQRLNNVAAFNPDEVSPTAAKWLNGATNRASAMHSLADIIENTEASSPEHMEAALSMLRLTQPIEDLNDADFSTFDSLPEDSQAKSAINELFSLQGRVAQSPSVISAMQKANEVLNNFKPAPITEESLATPEGQQGVQDSIAVASAAPEKGNLEANEQILYHAAQGRIQITPEQKAALDTSVAILRAAQAAAQEVQRLGNDSASAQVGRQVTVEKGDKGPSALDHAKGIMSAWKAGNKDLARGRLFEMSEFVQHMQNKVDALNRHFESGSPRDKVQYEARRSNGEWFTTKGANGLAVHPNNAGSVRFAQNVAVEAQVLTDVYNGLVTAFPDLDGQHVVGTPLNSSLTKPAGQVVGNSQPAPVVTPAPAVDATNTPAPVPQAPAKVVEPVAEKAPAPVEPKVEQTPVSEPSTEVETAPVPKLTGVQAVYPELIGSSDNHFVKSFMVPESQQSRTVGTDSPVQVIRDALKSQTAFNAFVGSELKKELTPEIAKAYADLLRPVEQIVDALNDSLATFAAKGKNLAAIQSGEALGWSNGKAANIAEIVDGEVRYNPELIETAVLAAVQWNQSIDQLGSLMDEKDLASLTGIDQYEITASMIENLNQGMGKDEAKQSLAQKIANYWGVRGNPDVGTGFTQGIPQAVASEILDLYVQRGLLHELSYIVRKDGSIEEYTKSSAKPVDGEKTIDRLLTNEQFNAKITGQRQERVEDPLDAFPDAIERAVMVEPEGINFIDQEDLPVAKTQLRNAIVQNTPQQLETIKNEQATPYYVNHTVASLYQALGVDNLVRLFGAGQFNPEEMNDNHSKSLDGQNRSVVASFNQLQGLLAEMSHAAGDRALTDVPVRFQFNMTRVSRAQMLGKYNPQSSKLVREAIMPTQSVLDMSNTNGQDYGRFMLGVAQSFGIKVHKMDQSVSREKAQAMIDGPLAPVIEALERAMNKYDEPEGPALDSMDVDSDLVDVMKKAFKEAGADLTPHSLHAVTQIAWMNHHSPEALKTFKTSLYLEADGVTNGPINGMVLLTAGEFDENWVRTISKGGLYFNRGAETVNSHNSTRDSNDAYQATTDALKGRLANLESTLTTQYPEAATNMKHLFVLMNEFLGDDLNFDAEGNLQLKRGIAKNPLTVTIYGAGEGGIAGKMSSIVIDAVYERMSEVMQGTNTFPAPVSEALRALIGSSMSINQDGEYVVKHPQSDRTGQYNPKTFTFTKGEKANLRSNMRHLFVTPMRAAIEATVGESLLKSADMVRQATQVQSIVMEAAFKAEVNAMLEAKAKADPNFRRSDSLSQKELNGIFKKLEHLAPLIKSPTQTFFVAGNQATTIDKLYLGQAFNDRFRTNAAIYGPSNAGVSGIPFLNIGAGDGQMMQNISTHPNAPTGTLKVFDGINLPLDQIESGSLVANEAVWDSWQGNPLRYVHDSYTQFLKNADLTSFDSFTKGALSEALFGLGNKDSSVDEIKEAMRNLDSRLLEGHQQVEARHRAMARVQTSTDQMASAASPHVRPGEVELFGTDDAGIAAQLNVLYNEELNKIQKNAPTESIGSAVREIGQKHATGAYVLNSAELGQLTKAITLPADQQQVLNQVNESLAAKGYRVVAGNNQQIADFMAQEGTTFPANAGKVFGMTSVNSKSIYLMNPSSETLVHELVHAATFENVLGHYSDEAFSAQNPQAAKAVERTEVLMKQFMNLELTQVSPDLSQAYSDAKAAINSYLTAEPTARNKASALNEFMAWGLSNRRLMGLAQRTTASKLAQIASSVFDAIKSMFFRGNRTAPAKGQDMFSNLLFNSSMLMKSNPTGRDALVQHTLYQNSQYGNSERLSKINDAFATTVGRYVRDTPLTLGQTSAKVVMQNAIQTGIEVARSFVSHGFNMSMQEFSTFQNIVSALATEAKVDPNAMAAAQRMYQHVTKNLKVEDFMADPTDNNQRYYAQQKFDAIHGVGITEVDGVGRTTLLPAFLALAITNDEFRAVLAKMDLPTTEKNNDGTLDAVLENMGNGLMDKLTATMSGTRKSKTVEAAIDALSDRITSQIEERDDFISLNASKVGGAIDSVNQWVVDGTTTLSQALLDIDKKAAARGASKITRAVTGFGAGIGALVNETSGQIVSEGLMATMNRRNMWEPFHTLINDIVGRTASNATVYDMIKGVRSMVQQARQQFRENLPALIASKFSRELTKEEWASLHTSMGKTDLAVLRGAYSNKEITAMLTKQGELAKQVKQLESNLKTEDAVHFAKVQSKAKQLAEYMMTGVAGKNLLRNAFVVSQLFGEQKSNRFTAKTQGYVDQVDRLVTMYALQSMNQTDKEVISSLAQSEADGLGFALSYLVGQRAEEQRKAVNTGAKLNHYKGHIPTALDQGASMLVADDKEFAKLKLQSYDRIASYTGSNIDKGARNKSYYFAPVAARAGFEQGIMQNVRQSVSGVDATTGFTLAANAGRITEPTAVKLMASRMASEKANKENLLPVYNSVGDVVAFERSLDPEIMQRVQGEQHLAKQVGIWRGRQFEEANAQIFNEGLLDALKAMYDKDLKAGARNKDQYVNVLASADPVLRDSLALMNVETQDYAEGLFGKDELWVRKDMLNDAFGYRSATIGDAWTGNTRWSPKTQEAVKNLAVSAFGNKAYRLAVDAERTIENFVSDAKVLIVVKSVIVPVSNLMSNVYQLAARGVPMTSIIKGFPKKTAEIDGYVKSRVRQIELEAELRAAAGDITAERKLKTEIQSITDGHKRLSIWPLIEAGEFSSISDATLSRDEIMLTSGRLQQYIEQLVNKLPGPVATMGRYAMITKDTALFQGLQKAVEYGDFLGKAVLYDDLLERQKKDKAYALGRITEEFVNYDRLAGRFRGKLEKLGLLWFYNFKIRSAKVAMSMIRNNPVHTLLATLAPAPSLFGKVGLPTMDNIFTKMADGTLDYSMGPGQGLRAPTLNPWLNLVN